MNSIEDIQFLQAAHKNAPIDLHADILFGNLKVADIPFLDLFRECMASTNTGTPGWKVFRRAQRAFHLGRYVEYAAKLAGDKIECGVFGGFSALLSCKILSRLSPEFDGKGFYLCDSFEGLSQPVEKDYVEVIGANGKVSKYSTHNKGHFAVDFATVSSRFSEYPGATLVKGWIPDVLDKLPETKWSYVHIDVDLYEPTMACLNYFYSRLVKGGVILNDDFGSPLFPGGGTSWKDFFEAKNEPYVVLDTGQSVYIKT